MKTILITGANRGLGLEFVRQLVQRKPSPELIFASCRLPNDAKDLQAIAASHSNVKILEIDIRNEATYGPAVETVKKHVGDRGLNVLINNAGLGSFEAYESVSREFLTTIMDVNLIGPMRITQAFLPLLKQGASRSGVESFGIERGAVINISSTFGSIGLNGQGDNVGYRESKAALNMFTKGLSVNLQKDRILTISQCPGWVSTRMGGPNAALTPEASVSTMLQIFPKLSEKHTGLFFQNSLPLHILQF